MALTVLYDGWPLVYQPTSPAGLHLLALLRVCPPEVQPRALLPGKPACRLPERVAQRVHETPDTPRERFFWRQRWLPRMAVELGADTLHLTTAGAPLFSRIPCVVSPSQYGWPAARVKPADFWGRARHAASSGGMARLRALFWPEDLPAPGQGFRAVFLPPSLSLDFPQSGSSPTDGEARPESLSRLDLPQTFILYHGPSDEASLRRLLDAWSWASGPLGAYYPLLLLSLDEAAKERLDRLSGAYELSESLRALPPVLPDSIPDLYRASSALFHPAPTAPWGGSLRQALSLGRPVVALHTPRSDALVGPAAYLVPGGDARAMGAALVTVIVEETVAESLSEAALQRAASWSLDEPGEALLAAYRAALEGGH